MNHLKVLTKRKFAHCVTNNDFIAQAPLKISKHCVGHKLMLKIRSYLAMKFYFMLSDKRIKLVTAIFYCKSAN